MLKRRAGQVADRSSYSLLNIVVSVKQVGRAEVAEFSVQT